jgi:hypothetical protein
MNDKIIKNGMIKNWYDQGLVNTAQLVRCALVRYAHSLAEKIGLFRLVKMTN